ncbi:hypothetical protein I6H07_06075 [Hafnia alvei]|nr:hypothetical protein [Hafnia alvei]MBI0275401.1 hypothetical protein [Hafnia alvei]PNK98604.1 hypothetical protein CEQ28_013920 [Hafnia alvei]
MASNLQLDSNWDIIIGRQTSRVGGVEYVTQLVKSRIMTLLGEWKQDKSLGLPWFTGLLGKHARASDIQSAVARVIINTNFVQNLISVDVLPDYVNRQVTVTFVAESTFGTTSGTTSL